MILNWLFQKVRVRRWQWRLEATLVTQTTESLYVLRGKGRDKLGERVSREYRRRKISGVRIKR